MNDDLNEQMRDLGKSCADMGNRISEMLRPQILAMEEFQKHMAPVLQQASIAYNSWIKANPHIFENMTRAVKVWQEQQKQDVAAMAESGWFPNWFTFDYDPEEEVDLDMLMTMHLNDCWSKLTDKIIESCPNRKHILEVAFRLHSENNFIASIPLFLSQADGICQEEMTYLFCNSRKDNKPLFQEEKTNKLFRRLIEEGTLRNGFLVDILLEPFKVKTPFSQNFDPLEEKGEEEGPNRHGIMHGHRNYLDYGTELNSLKSLSLLAFVVYSTKVVFKK